jgi:aryl-alcohol dehydrogenase-like predicted oxidoreductase
MQQRAVGVSGLRVSRLGLGTMTWGRDTDEHEAAEQLTQFVDAGGSLVDTAAAYGAGASEEVLGRLIGSAVPRDELVLATKAGVSRAVDGRRSVNTSRGALLDALDASMLRLGVDHVDLWQLHTWSDETPLEETLAALDTAVASGRTRYVGISNYSGWQTSRAATWQVAWPGRAPVVSTQMEYSLLQRGVEREVVPACQALGLGLFPWSPLGRGVLTGKYRAGTPADSRAASPHFASFVQPFLHAEHNSVVSAVATAAEGLGLSPLEVALAWVRDRPGVTAPIVGARTAGQLSGILTVEELELPDEIRTALDDVSLPPTSYPDDSVRPVGVGQDGRS